jgi:hypothetical protein
MNPQKHSIFLSIPLLDAFIHVPALLAAHEYTKKGVVRMIEALNCIIEAQQGKPLFLRQIFKQH